MTPHPLEHTNCDDDLTHPEAVAQARSSLIEDACALRLAELFKIIGDPTRVRILSALDAAELCVYDIAAVVGMTQSAVSHQLRVLRGAHLVKARREGKHVFYSLDDEHVRQLFERGLDHIHHASS